MKKLRPGEIVIDEFETFTHKNWHRLKMLKQHPDKFRGTGRTTSQMKAAPLNAVFVWCNYELHTPARLAHNAGRSDLRLVTPAFLSFALKHRGEEFTGIIVDHALELDKDQQRGLDMLLPFVRVPA
jgi:hypothetical protein